MFKKIMFSLLMVITLMQFTTPAVYAMGEPTGNCAPDFTLVMAMDHDNHQHKHVGDTDVNGDGFVCMKPVTPSGKIHIHIDNNLP